MGTTTDLANVTRKLKEKSPRLLASWRADGESPDQALRLVKQLIPGTDTTAIAYEFRFLEKQVKEAVWMELPEKLRGHVCTLDKSAFFEFVLAKIDEEENNYQASKEDRNSGWKTAERRRECREGQRDDRRTPPPPSQPQSPQKKTNGGQF
ncbi:hypothetical protein AAG570_012613 [Ranatra chinensis]|uniref:Gag protein n=1 Tax=Ranatra chinensis TaxID=642074 RepID=A0ABD0Z0L2_9HEMI